MSEKTYQLLQCGELAVKLYRRRRQKHLHLYVRPGGEVRVTAGLRVSRQQIINFVLEKSVWIQKTTAQWAHSSRHGAHWRAVEGGLVPFLGREFKIRIASNESEPRVNGQSGRRRVLCEIPEPMRGPVYSQGDELIVQLPGGQGHLYPYWSTDNGLDEQAEGGATRMSVMAAQALLEFYQHQARLILGRRVVHFAKTMAVQPRRLRFATQRTRWGSCSSRGTISLNWGLVVAPLSVIDYVIVHELAHLRHFNHSFAFWTLVGQHCPEFKDAKLWLKQHAMAFEFIHKLRP